MKLHAAVHAEILGAFCLAFGMVLAVTDHMTEGDIATRAMEDKQNSLTQVIPTALHDNNPASDTVSVKDADGTATVAYRARINGQVTAVAYEIHGTGYAGDIRLVMGVDAAGHLLGVRVLAHKETPGLGDRIEEKKSDWIRRFTGLSLGHPPADRWKVKKDGGDFDQFAGATITPRGVVTAVHRGLDFFSAHKTQLLGTS